MSTTLTQTATAVQDTLASLSLSGAKAEASAEVTAHTPDLARAERTIQGPLKKTGALDGYEQREETPVIGRTYFNFDIAAVLEQANVDELLRELAIVISERNVVFLRNQAGKLSNDQLKTIAHKLGTLSGRPAASDLHIHPTEHIPDLHISPITPAFGAGRFQHKPFASARWHSDITFEPHPSDFAMLQIYEMPAEGGGDTLWASAYEAYDRLTPAYQRFIEGLTAVNDGNGFHQRAKVLGIECYAEERGHPRNKGADLSTVHPVVRTNPVTGWKGLFVNKAFTKRIVELSPDESEQVLSYLFRVVADNHDLQVRFKWESNDLAIWSNASSFHTVTVDYESDRNGNRAVSLGERPYFDPTSVSRRDALGLN